MRGLDRPRALIGAGAVLLVLVALVVLFGWPVGLPVDIKHGQLPGSSGSFGDPGDVIGCYTSGTTGDLVNDPSAGIVIVEQGGYRHVVDWPPGWTGRRSGSEVEVLDDTGNFVVRTGTKVSLLGGYLPNPEQDFLACYGSHPLP